MRHPPDVAYQALLQHFAVHAAALPHCAFFPKHVCTRCKCGCVDICGWLARSKAMATGAMSLADTGVAAMENASATANNAL